MCSCACHSSPSFVHRCGCIRPALTSEQQAQQLAEDTTYWQAKAEAFDAQVHALFARP